MSQENVENLRRAYDAFNRGDFDVAIEAVRSDFEFVRAGGQGSVRGAAAFRAWMEPDAFEDLRIEPIEIRAHRNKVLVHGRSKASGAGSGIELDFANWAVWTFDEEGFATRVEAFLEHEKDEALAAAGLD